MFDIHAFSLLSRKQVFSNMALDGSSLKILRDHKASCDDESCGCKLFEEYFETWSERLPLDPMAPGDTWLWFSTGPSQSFCWVCVACHRTNFKNNSMSSCWKISNLLRHHNSASHLRHVAAFLGKPKSYFEGLGCDTASTQKIELFKDVFRQSHSGQAASQGYILSSGIVGVDKLNKILWCLLAADIDLKRDALRIAETLNISRDERHGRLHIRFRCTTINSVFHGGYLGQAIGFQPDALGKTEATRGVYKAFCTKFHDPPTDAVVCPEFDEKLFDHMRKVTEAISVDSAANEIVSANDMVRGVCGEDPFTPNCKYILRDAAHSARRVLSRLWKADQVLDDLMSLLVHDRDSIGQIVQHSDELRRLYRKCCENNDEKCVSTVFGHLRAAKHRIETHSTPLSRIVLNISGTIAFAVQVSMLRKGKREGKCAEVFLRSLNVEMLLLAAMMADAAAVALHFIRILDTEDLAVPELCSAVEDFLDRISYLFHKGGCFVVDGHVSFIVKWLETTHFSVSTAPENA